jgi:type IV secretory pathway TrbD component
MRILLPALLCLTVGVCTASNYRDIQRAVADDQMLQSAGVSPADAQVRKQCSAAVVETDDPPEFFDCVYVQTANDLNLFSLEDGYLMSELQLTLHNMDGVALQHMGRYSQVQIFSGDRVAALYIHGKQWIDPAQTEGVYQWLVAHGVPAHEPRKWIGP